MAENQTASEDSGQQQPQQQQQPDQDQPQTNQQSQQADSSPDQDSSSDSITPNPRAKTLNLKNCLTSIKVPRAMTSTSVEGNHQSAGGGKQHHHHNHHHHNLHNSASSGHHGHNVIHKTTSESLRLGSDHPGSSNMTNSTSKSGSIHGGGSSSLATTTKNSNSTTSNHSHSMSSSSSHSHSHQHPPPQRKSKASSFQITSVTVGNKLSSDNGDDSADDLDESHTDDNSRITDLENETPSVSEDTFSKEDVFFANNALSTTAPVIPTSAQYGLVVVDPIGPSVGQTIQNVQVNVADNIINVVSAVGNKKKPEVKETQHRSERFKVVKIESTEPFRRGRWMCMDYLDHSGNQALNKELNPDKSVSSVSAASGSSGEDAAQTAIILTNDTSANAAGGVENHIDAAAKLTADGNLNIYRSESQTSAGTGQNANPTIIHAQTLGGPMNLQQSQLPNQVQGPTVEGQTMPLATDFQALTQLEQKVNGNEAPVAAGQSQPASFFANQLNATPGNGSGGSSAPATFQTPQHQSTPAHGVTLPANILMQNGGGSPAIASFQPVPFIPPPVAPSGAEISIAPVTSIEQQQPSQQAQSSRAYVSPPSTGGVAAQSYPSPAITPSSAAYTNAPAVSDSTVTTQETQPSELNAATPSDSGQPQVQSQETPQPVQLPTNPLAGQTMPILNSMTYDVQAQQPTQTATPSPATISDPTAIAVTIQQQQQIDNNSFSTNNNSTAASSSTTAESSTNNSGGGGSEAGTNSLIPQTQTQPQAPSSSSSLSVAGSVQGSTSGGSTAAASTTGSTDEHQLHHNPETETESSASSLALALANRRKRNSSIPQLPILAPIFNFNESTDLLNDTSEDIPGTQNIFTNLALGDDRYKLQSDRYASDETVNSLDAYAVTRSLPIAISGAGTLGRQMNYNVMAYSASPTTSTYPYSPFYYGSPSSPETLAQPLSMSYDPTYESNRLYVPTLMSQVHHRTIANNDNDRLIRVIDGSGRSGLDGLGKTSSATAAVLAKGGATSVLNSASGTSAVAIDNKIEQAMDLVKSHLMIAVREEVEVLKEKISELMDKINQLEVENTILKANMSQETLHQLQVQAQLQIAGTGTGNIIAQPPQTQSQPPQQQTQPPTQQQQPPTTQQPQQPSQQQTQQSQPAPPQAANPANTTNGPMS